MISQELISEAQAVMTANAQKFQAPPLFLIELVNQKGQELAEILHAYKNIVLVGTILMDVMLGPAIKENKIGNEHVLMAVERAREMFVSHPELTEDEKKNILFCITEHHGGVQFSSLESEICCNADCYKFISVEGVVGGIHGLRDMSVPDIVKLYSEKADEKWNALSLEICKTELESQYQAIQNFFNEYRK